jgi:phosphoribosyl 1,2-cyclic phosphodiesterase
MIKIHATGSSGNFYSLETSTGTLLIECGINIKKIKEYLDFDLSNVQGVILSHSHKDHSKSAKDIIKCGIDIYGSKGTGVEIELIDSYRYKVVEHNKPFKVGSFTIVPFNVQHDVNEPLGFLIYHKELGKILFITDSYFVKNRFNNVDHILIECNYSEDVLPTLPQWRARTIRSHMSLETLKEMLLTMDLSQTKDITLIHISHDNGEPERFRQEVEELTGIKTYIGERGLVIE